MKKKFLQGRFYFPFIAIFFGISACTTKSEPPTQEAPVHEAFTLKREAFASELRLPGELEGYYETGVMAKVNGYIKTTLVDIGDHVVKNQLVAELEAPELESQLASASADNQARLAEFLNEKSKYLRLLQTNKTKGAVSPYDLEVARTTYISDSLGHLATQAKYDAIRQLVAYLKITAPFNGIVTERAMAPGGFVGPNDNHGTPLFRIKQENILRLHIAVPEKYIAQVKQNSEVHFTVKSFPDKIFSGRITRMSKNLNTQTRSEIVEIEINNADGKLLPGMYATAILPLNREKESLLVPVSAVVTSMEDQFVIRVRKNRLVEHVSVSRGDAKNHWTEVFGNLAPGDTILYKASEEIRKGDEIKIIVVSPDQAKEK